MYRLYYVVVAVYRRLLNAYTVESKPLIRWNSSLSHWTTSIYIRITTNTRHVQAAKAVAATSYDTL